LKCYLTLPDLLFSSKNYTILSDQGEENMTEPSLTKEGGVLPDERIVPVMFYSLTTVARGGIAIKSTLRANIWIRTEAVSEYVYVRKAQVVTFGGPSIQPETYQNYFMPTSQVIAYHVLPPNDEPLDYDETEMNRKMEAVTAMVGTFRFNGQIRISSQISLAANLDTMKSSFLSLYNVEVSNPFLQGMGAIKVPLVLMRPHYIHFGLK